MKKYRIIPMTGAIANKYYKVQRLFFNIFWVTVTDWIQSVEIAEQWVKETSEPKNISV